MNHDRRLDLSSRVINAPEARIAPAEGVLGQTLAVLYGAGPLDSAFDQADVVEVWDPEENDHLHHSTKLEAFLSQNYHVSGLFSDDAARTNFRKELEHAYFQVCPHCFLPTECFLENHVVCHQGCRPSSVHDSYVCMTVMLHACDHDGPSKTRKHAAHGECNIVF